MIFFVLPAPTSYIFQPLAVAVFGPFRRFNYPECASLMWSNIGRVLTKYEMTEVACKSYLKAPSPSNEVSAFKKTDICQFAKDAVPLEKMSPSASVQDTTPLQKLNAILSGKEAVE